MTELQAVERKKVYSGDDRSRHLDSWPKTDRSLAATLVSWSGVAPDGVMICGGSSAELVYACLW